MLSISVPPVTSDSADVEEVLQLLELSPDLLKSLRDEDNWYIKGMDDDDDLCICTGERTYRVRQVQSSNLSLILDPTTGQVQQISSTYLEPTRIPPQLERLHRLLAAHPYDPTDVDIGKGGEAPIIADLLPDRLFGLVQASDAEIHSALQDAQAILINGMYRILSADYCCRVFGTLFAGLTLLDHSATDRIPVSVIEEIFADASDFPPDIIKGLFFFQSSSSSSLSASSSASYGRLLRPNGEMSGEWTIELNCWKILRFFANELLKAKPVWMLEDLMIAWKKLIYDIPLNDPKMILSSGLALLEPLPGTSATRVTYFPSSNLPVDPTSRFARLFEVNSRWEYERLEGYVEESAKAMGVAPAELIVKYGRICSDPTSGARLVTPLLLDRLD